VSTPEFADEVVTKALVRYLDVPEVSGEIALITLENGLDHTRPSTFGPAGLASIDDAMDAIEAHTPKVAAIAVTGKPFIFAVGADISGVPSIANREQAEQVGRLGHRVFRRLLDSAVPTFAFVNGAVMGGGLELALHCHYRTLAKKAAAIAFPEVFLGLVPGWGGTQLLPKLVGPDAAVKIIIENAMNQNKMLSPKQAGDLGVVDALLDDADFLAQSLVWAAGVLNGTVTVERPDHALDDWDGPLARGRAFAQAKTNGAAPAAFRALDLIELSRTADLTEGTAAEDAALADLIMGDELRASLYAFDLVNKRAKRPAGAPDKSLARKITKVGVVGAGLMAGQLALLFARRLEVPVVLTDIDQARVDKGVAYVHGELDQMLAKGRISQDKANRLKALVNGSLTKDVFADADLVIEAVFEEVEVKKQVFAEVEEFVSPEAILATNTSSLSVTEMAADLKFPERVVGLHFFNPVAVMPLLEVIKADKTDDATLATAFAAGKTLGKTTILVKDSASFVANRLLGRFMGEISKVVDEGTPIEVADSSVGGIAPMPPFVLLALVGPAIALHNSETLHSAFGDRFYVSENLRKIVTAKKPAIYLWDTGKPEVDPEIAAFFEVAEPPVVLTQDEVRERVLSALAEEARRILDEGVVSAPEDIDLAMITGAGFSFWNGGITPLLDRTGFAEKVTGRRFLAPGVASVPA
jgi:3-hydroxyacyl-CoA dehydrogenase/enoyl-CoA hydratase/carnithine racemase